MTQVYADQIWHQSQCRLAEAQALEALRSTRAIPVLVDAVDTQRTYRRPLVTDNVVNLDHIALYPEFWGTFAYQPRYEPRAPTKLFNCFINRVCTTRQSWFYQFARRNLLTLGNVSFLLDARQEPRGLELYEQNFKGYEIFAAEHELMRDQVPFVNFDCELEQAVIDSQVSVVIETYFDWPGTIAFSEKTFRALQLPRPMLMYNMPGAVSVLRKYGFDVWDDIVDHSYDQEPDQIQRQIAILDQLCAWQTQCYSDQQLDQFEQRATHNQQRLQALRAQWPNRLKNILDQLKC